MSGPQKQTPGWSPANATTNVDSTAIVDRSVADDKTIATLRARFALRGHVLTVSRNVDGRVNYTITKWGQARTFSHQHDLVAFLAQIGGSA